MPEARGRVGRHISPTPLLFREYYLTEKPVTPSVMVETTPAKRRARTLVLPETPNYLSATKSSTHRRAKTPAAKPSASPLRLPTPIGRRNVLKLT
jgi:hypothetical protein